MFHFQAYALSCTGRTTIQDAWYQTIERSPGNLWGDRTHLAGYCHRLRRHNDVLSNELSLEFNVGGGGKADGQYNRTRSVTTFASNTGFTSMAVSVRSAGPVTGSSGSGAGSTCIRGIVMGVCGVAGVAEPSACERFPNLGMKLTVCSAREGFPRIVENVGERFGLRSSPYESWTGWLVLAPMVTSHAT